MDWNPPDTCLCGAAMVWPNVTVSWSPCPCARAQGKPTGHTQQRCEACGRMWRANNCDLLVDGRPLPGDQERHKQGRQGQQYGESG